MNCVGRDKPDKIALTGQEFASTGKLPGAIVHFNFNRRIVSECAGKV